MMQQSPSGAGMVPQQPMPSDQQYAAAQQQQQQPVPPPSGWAPQPVPPPAQHQQQQQQYGGAAAHDSCSNEIKTLWIGDLQHWMDENYLMTLFNTAGEVVSAKVIRNKQTGLPDGYGFIEFVTRATVETVLMSYNMTPMPNIDQVFRLNWASYGGGERRPHDGPDYTIFVGDLAADVTDYMLQETFRAHYPSMKGAKVVSVVGASNL